VSSRYSILPAPPVKKGERDGSAIPEKRCGMSDMPKEI